jgi:2-polyprenyl-3-methyl-5-hydroxy-6-metoxy-1,4-benzoquinol methylase
MLLETILSDKGLLLSTFEDAFAHAVSLYKGIDIEQSERIKIAAAISYYKDRSVCDLGSYINPYPIVLALLGMHVTTVDYYPQALPEDHYYNPHIQSVLDIYRSVGIKVIQSDLYEYCPSPDTFDVVTSFEVFEHLWHSPKPILEASCLSLKQHGTFILSIPNIARLANRLRMIVGHSPLPRFPLYFEHGNPFTGHRREMTMAEVNWMMTRMGLKKVKLFSSNIQVPTESFSSRLYSSFTTYMPMPRRLRATIYAIYVKE